MPVVAMVGLSLFEHAADTAAKHWGIAVRFVYHNTIKKIYQKFFFPFTNINNKIFEFQYYFSSYTIFSNLGEC